MATLQNISIPSIPSVPQFPSIPTSIVSVNLPCGQNPALDALTLVQNKIKDQLASGKGALGTLGTLINTANEKLLAIQPKIEEFYSFQSDLASLKDNPSPATIAAVLNRWKGKVPGLEGYITKATDLLSKTPLDYCQDLPNIKINQETGAVSIEAKTAIIPNESPPIAASLTPTVVDNTSDTTISGAGLSFQVLKDYLDKVSDPYRSQVYLPIMADNKKAKKEFDASINGKTPIDVFGNKMRNFGMSSDQLEAAGLLTAEEIAVKNTYQVASKIYLDKTYVLTWAADWRRVYEQHLIDPNDEAYITDKKKLDTDPVFKKYPSNYFNITESILDQNKNLLIDYANYKKNNPSYNPK
jgi:hypothetical protein